MLSSGLILLAFWAAPDEVDDSLVHLGPPEVSSDEFDGLVLTHVACYLAVMFRFEYQLYPSFQDPE